jgi:hypothetical protein
LKQKLGAQGFEEYQRERAGPQNAVPGGIPISR